MKIRYVMFAIALAAQSAMAQERHEERLGTAQSLRQDHEEIQFALQQAIKQSGAVGQAARELDAVLRPHFQSEAIALPPLGLLRRLVEDQDVRGLQHWLLPMTDSLRAQLPRMLTEHQAIGAARARLEVAARRARKRSFLPLTQQLAAHAQAEEEIYYPMALLVGEVVRSRMALQSGEHALGQ